MQAIAYHRYGGPDVLECEEIEKPVPADNQVLIRVCAASVNPLDLGVMAGKPAILRLFFGLRTPKITHPGRDVAGRVEAVGRSVTQFKPGDAVFGVCSAGSWSDQAGGSFAEYACTAETSLAIKPDAVTFEQAAAAPVAALTALQGLRDKGHVRPTQKVLVHGAAGGVGTFAVQVAKALGAEVTGVTSTENLELVRSLGADRVMDYTHEDFTRSAERYDVIFDCYAHHPLLACRKALNPQGTYIPVGGPGPTLTGILVSLVKMRVLSWMGSRQFVVFMARINQDDLKAMSQMMAAGQVKPVVDQCYPLIEVADAMRALEGKHVRGKLVIRIAEDE